MDESVKGKFPHTGWVRADPLLGGRGAGTIVGMSFLKRLRKSAVGQTTSEYMILLSVVAIGALAAFAYFAEPSSPVQQAGADVANNYSQGLTNGGGQMRAQ